MWDFLAKPFGIIMEFIYRTLAFENYGLAIILFTVFVRLLILPLTIKQQKSSLKMQALQPELNALKERYGDDRQKLYEEQNKIYQKYGVSSLAGCFPTLIQFPIILVIYRIIRRPLSFLSGMTAEAITKIGIIAGLTEKTAIDSQINIIAFFRQTPEKIAEAAQEIGSTAAELESNLINMRFLKIFDLSLTPKVNFWVDWKVYLPLLLIPLLVVATSYLQQWLLTPRKKKGEKDPSAGAMNIMTKLLPLMTMVFCFILPAGLGLYFLVGNVLSIGQTALINKLYKKKKEGA